MGRKSVGRVKTGGKVFMHYLFGVHKGEKTRGQQTEARIIRNLSLYRSIPRLHKERMEEAAFEFFLTEFLPGNLHASCLRSSYGKEI